MSADGRLFAQVAVNLARSGFPCRELSCTVRPFASSAERTAHEVGMHPELVVYAARELARSRPRPRLDFGRAR